jgi:hypothetical protein
MDVTPDTKRIQIEEIQYKSGVSEATLFKMGAAINYLLNAFFPVGTIIKTMLTEAQYIAEIGVATGSWMLCNGQTCAGSRYETLTGNTNTPDFRGRYLRMKDNGAGVNPDGELALGAFQDDAFESHTHNHVHNREDPPFNADHHRWQKGPGDATLTTTTDPTGGNETRPKTGTVNFMIRVD